MDVLNQHFVVVDENAGFLGLGAKVRSEVDGVVVAEKVVYGVTLHAIARHSRAQVLGDEEKILDTYRHLPKEFK